MHNFCHAGPHVYPSAGFTYDLSLCICKFYHLISHTIIWKTVGACCCMYQGVLIWFKDQGSVQLLQPEKSMCFGYERNYWTKHLVWSNHNVSFSFDFFLSSCIFQKKYVRNWIDLKEILQLGIGNILYNSMWLMKYCVLPSGLLLWHKNMTLTCFELHNELVDRKWLQFVMLYSLRDIMFQTQRDIKAEE